jgi:hypothetical protein
MIKRTLRFIGSLISGPIVRVSLNLFARLSRYQCVFVGAWRFAGPPAFLELVEEAEQRLRAEDSLLFSRMDARFLVLYDPKHLFSFPFWKCGGISEHYAAWGAEGVLAGWIYLLYDLISVDKGRWALRHEEMTISANQRAKANTREWLIEHKFPTELSDAFH